jgi:hypothetical protein
MRVMEIPPFPREFDNPDLANLERTRLSQKVVMWRDQAIPLVGYMAWPNESVLREKSLRILRSWREGSKTVPPRLHRIQHEWLRVADVFHTYCDLIDRQRQQRRGGPSIGKAITLVAAKAKSRGTGAANLWHCWKKYKDVAHLVTAATLVCLDVRKRFGDEPLGPFALGVNQYGPFQMTMLLPDLILAVALEFERYGLGQVPFGKAEPTFNPETVWRIPADIKVVPFPHLIRQLSRPDLTILAARRAGNRGRANRRETTPASD